MSALLLWILATGADPAGVLKLSIGKLALAPESYVSRSIEVEGLLKNVGSSYFRGARFEILDGEASFEVSPWLPLETVPPRMGVGAARKKVMSDYLGRKVRLRGKVVELKADKEDVTRRFRITVEQADIVASAGAK